MGDIRNKLAKIDRARRERAAMNRFLGLPDNHTQTYAPPPPPITCNACGASEPWVIQYDRWRKPLFLCDAHLPEWAAYDIENGERQDRMCNLYSMMKGQQAIRKLVKAMRDLTGNLPPLPAIFPNRMAPVVRVGQMGSASC